VVADAVAVLGGSPIRWFSVRPPGAPFMTMRRFAGLGLGQPRPPARAGTGQRPRFIEVKPGVGNLWSRAAVRLCSITAPASSVATFRPGISRSAWALTRVAISRARQRSAGLAHVGERAGPGRPTQAV
jgi:hypothetical protein